MRLTEYRIPLPLTLEEYRIGQLFTIAELSKSETGGGEGVELLKEEEFEGTPLFDDRYDRGTYTHKVYHMTSKMPPFIRLLFDKDTLGIHEEAWNAFPYCRTVITNPAYMKDNFSIVIETLHVSDRGDEDNVHKLPDELLERRAVVGIDIGNDSFSGYPYKREADPSVFVSQAAGRGPLRGDWARTCEPVMTCYKLLRADFKWLGLQNRVENIILETEQKIFLRFNRQLFCWIDRWYGLTLDDIRKLERKTKKELKSRINRGSIKDETLYREEDQ